MLVLGGGIGGLSAAHYLLKYGFTDVKLIEASLCVGGWVQSRKDNSGILFEKGPRTVRVTGPQGLNTLSLIEELGLSEKVKPILKSHPSAKNRLIYVNKRLWPLPTELRSIFKTVPPFSKPLVFALIQDFFKAKKTCDDDSLFDFIERRFGYEIADYLISSLVCGICAGDAKEISVKFLIPHLFESEQKYGSALKGLLLQTFSLKKRKTETKQSEPSGILVKRAIEEKWNVYGLDNGLDTLPKQLHNSVLDRGAQILCGSKIVNISFQDGNVTCKTESKELKSEHAVCSLPAYALAPLVKKEHPQLTELLQKIPFVTVCVVNLAYKGRNTLEHNAFGFLIPPSQKLPILGVIFDSCNFPQGDWTVLTVMMGGRWYDEYIGDNKSEDDILKLVNEQIKTILGIHANPDKYEVSILRKCIPQYIVGHHDNVNRIFDYIKNHKLPLTLVGSSYRGVGVNDVIMSAKQGVEQLKESSS